jgi:ATP-dependent DNA ligase
MEARSVADIPTGAMWQYEPKWDGFRCLIFRDGGSVRLQSKSGEDLTRYFPEIAAEALALPATRYALDGELVIPQPDGFSFDALLQRIHPAASRIARLSKETPALFIAFDLLAAPRQPQLAAAPLRERRPRLDAFARKTFGKAERFRLSVASDDPEAARRWLAKSGGGCDGVIAKRLDLPYQSGTREGMQKIKRLRSADCVIGGYRYASTAGKAGKTAAPQIGSLLLGLYDADGKLDHVGFTSAIKAADRAALTTRIERLKAEHSFTGRTPGGPSRWATARSAAWQAVKPTLVVEVCYDHVSDGRFRHGTRILRWRPDKRADQCRLDQLQQVSADPRVLLVTW